MSDLISRQAAIEAVHKSIYDFFDICDDDEESPMTYKDELLLELNKAITTQIKAVASAPTIEAEPTKHYNTESYKMTVTDLPPVEYAPIKHGKWIVNNETKEWVTIYCDQCHDGMWNRKDDPYPNYCFNCGARMDTPNNAHWIKQPNGEYKCSVCGDTTLAPLYECGTCGTKMGGVENG